MKHTAMVRVAGSGCGGKVMNRWHGSYRVEMISVLAAVVLVIVGIVQDCYDQLKVDLA